MGSLVMLLTRVAYRRRLRDGGVWQIRRRRLSLRRRMAVVTLVLLVTVKGLRLVLRRGVLMPLTWASDLVRSLTGKVALRRTKSLTGR
jgi:hypothetical protein